MNMRWMEWEGGGEAGRVRAGEGSGQVEERGLQNFQAAPYVPFMNILK